MRDRIMALADKAAVRSIAFRRDFHQHPELGFTEFRTASLIARRCKELGLAVKVGPAVVAPNARLGLPSEQELDQAYQRAVAEGGDPEYLPQLRGGFTGVVAELKTGRPGPTIGFRFDIDALPVREDESENHVPTREGFRSVHEGIMHACGHDAHAAIGLGFAEVLVAIADQLSGTFRLIFQPAEEGCRGAYAMTEAGVVDDIDYMLGAHIGGRCPSGHFHPLREGFMASTKYSATFKGAAAHASSSPEQGRNAILAAAEAIEGLYAISRHSAAPTRVNVGIFKGGSGRNLIPDWAYLALEVRGQNDKSLAYMEHRTEKVLEGAAHAQECELELSMEGRALTLTPDADLVAMMGEVARQIDGLQVHDEAFVSGGSEDYTVFGARVQAHGGKVIFAQLGSTTPGLAHTYTFDLVEDDLRNGIAFFALAAARLGQPQQ